MRRNPYQVHVRVSEREREILEQGKREEGFETDSEFVRWLIRQYRPMTSVVDRLRSIEALIEKRS